jgi:integrase
VAFEAVHPHGSEARLALYLYMATGASRIDGVRLGFKNIAEDGKIYLSRSKTKVGRGSTIPAFLGEELERLPKDDECFLMTKYGHPFSEKAFENKFKKWATKAGIPQSTIHDLRKIIAVKLATSGANKHEIAAWLAHDGTQTVDVYTKDVERDRLIENAQKRLGWKPFNLELSSPNSLPTGNKPLKVKEQIRKWQPVGESNPSFQVENLAS